MFKAITAVAFAVLGAAHTINVYSSTLTPSAAHSWLLSCSDIWKM